MKSILLASLFAFMFVVASLGTSAYAEGPRLDPNGKPEQGPPPP